jgi:hypothetical protein
MLLSAGHWSGKGSLLLEGRSLGEELLADADVEVDEGGVSVRVTLTLADNTRQLIIRVAGNEVGTYVVNVRSEFAASLIGTAKLDSEPNLGLLWNENGTLHLTFTLFSHSAGLGCRGFLREGDATYTWEMALVQKRQLMKGDNVVSLRPRR